MQGTMTKWQLFGTLTVGCGVESSVTNSQGETVRGLVSSITREDGSGRCFNVGIHCGQDYRVLFVKTTD